jgi:hypothetical protein
MTPEQKRNKRVRYNTNLKLRKQNETEEQKQKNCIDYINRNVEKEENRKLFFENIALTHLIDNLIEVEDKINFDSDDDDEYHKTINIEPYFYPSNNKIQFDTPDEYLYTPEEVNKFCTYRETMIDDINYLLSVFEMNNKKISKQFIDTYPFYQLFFNRTFIEPLNILKQTTYKTVSYKTLDTVKNKLNTMRNNIDKLNKQEITIDDLILNDGFFN